MTTTRIDRGSHGVARDRRGRWRPGLIEGTVETWDRLAALLAGL